MNEEIEIKVLGSKGTFDATWDERTTKCRGKTCGQQIGFAVTRNGKKLPIDPEPVETAKDGTDIYATHFSTCPDAKGFK